MKKRIVLLGPPAAGKGTQADKITAKYQIANTSPGAIFRQEARLGTDLGQAAEALTKFGKLVPDQMINAVVESWLEKHDREFVFDGYPRSVGQAEALEKLLTVRSMPLEVVLLLKVDAATISDRIARRLVCAKCGRILSAGLHVPTAQAPCPSCGGRLERRGDDTPETLALRMGEYAGKTEPLIRYYENRSLLREVDATRAPDVVFASIVTILESE